MVQNKKTRRSGRRTINDRDIEAVRSLKYLGTVIKSTNDETEEISTGILSTDRASYSLQTLFRSKQMHRNKKIRPYKSVIKCLLWKSNLDPNTSDRGYDTYIWKEKKKN